MKKNRFNSDAETKERVSVYELIVLYVGTVVFRQTRSRLDAEDYTHSVLLYLLREDNGVDLKGLLEAEATELSCETLSQYGFTMKLLKEAIRSEAVRPIWREQQEKRRRPVFSIKEFDQAEVASDVELKSDIEAFVAELPVEEQVMLQSLDSNMDHEEIYPMLGISRATYFRRLASLRERLTKVLTNDR